MPMGSPKARTSYAHMVCAVGVISLAAVSGGDSIPLSGLCLNRPYTASVSGRQSADPDATEPLLCRCGLLLTARRGRRTLRGWGRGPPEPLRDGADDSCSASCAAGVCGPTPTAGSLRLLHGPGWSATMISLVVGIGCAAACICLANLSARSQRFAVRANVDRRKSVLRD